MKILESKNSYNIQIFKVIKEIKISQKIYKKIKYVLMKKTIQFFFLLIINMFHFMFIF